MYTAYTSECKNASLVSFVPGTLYAIHGLSDWVYMSDLDVWMAAVGQALRQGVWVKIGKSRSIRAGRSAVVREADFGAEPGEWYIGGPIWRERRFRAELARRAVTRE